MGRRLIHGRTSQPQNLLKRVEKLEKRGMPQRACGSGMVSLFIDEKSAG
jgi:hypothetical protein